MLADPRGHVELLGVELEGVCAAGNPLGGQLRDRMQQRGLDRAATVAVGDEQGAVEAMLGDGRLAETELPAGFLDLLDRERRYRGALREWQQYQEWTRSRNPARAELERRHGYDTKHAMHLIRLLRMAVEILERHIEPRKIDIKGAQIIVSGGYGMGSKENFDLLFQLAEVLGAEVGASRAAVDAGYADHDRSAAR